MKLSSSALLKAVWMELSSFWASWRCSPRANTCAAFSWQNRAWARSRASSVRPRSSSRSWCIRWYCRRTSSFSSHTLSCRETKHQSTQNFLCVTQRLESLKMCAVAFYAHGAEHTSTTHLSESSLQSCSSISCTRSSTRSCCLRRLCCGERKKSLNLWGVVTSASH